MNTQRIGAGDQARPEPADPQAEATGAHTISRAWLYDVDGVDAPVRLDSDDIRSPGDNQLLWVDVDLASVGELDRLWDELGITGHMLDLEDTGQRPRLVQHNGVIQLNVFVRSDPGSNDALLHCLVGTNWVVTAHEGDVDLVGAFNEPFHGETHLGALDGPKFLSMVLDWQLSGYFKTIEALQVEIDHLDEELLQLAPDEKDLLGRLLGLRRQLRRLRLTLAPHRDLLALLSNPEAKAVVGSQAAPHYQRVLERLERALDAVEATREMIVGSFDIFMTRTAQATNDTMKLLTVVSVLLLPAAVIAGIMGMNFKVGIFDRPWMFWVTLGMMVALAATTLLVAKRRKWL